MDIDVRKGAEVDRIIFGQDEEYIFLSATEDIKVSLRDCDGDIVYISIEDIPNLIKALQKAQEIWGEK